jgi:hypothetical protein
MSFFKLLNKYLIDVFKLIKFVDDIFNSFRCMSNMNY